MNIDKQQEFYNSYWAEMQLMNSLKLRRATKILEYFKEPKKKFKNPRILDFGCGDGRFAAIIGFFGPTKAIDLSDAAIERAQKLFPWVEYETHNALEYDKEPEFYDCIVSQEVIEHVYEQDQYLQNVRKLLVPGGYLILTTPNKFVFDRREGGNWSNQPIENILEYNALKNLIKRNGFKIIKSNTIIPNFGNKGILKYINHRYIIGGFRKLGISGLRERLVCKLGFGIHSVILARKV